MADTARSLAAAGFAVGLLVPALAGCGSDSPEPPVEGDAASAHHADSARPAAASVDGIAAVDPWVRTAVLPGPAAGDTAGEHAPPVNSAAYLVLRNATEQDDALVTVESAVADTAEIHSVSMDAGVMRMRPVEAVDLPAGREASLQPGGYHIMLVGLGAPLLEGDTVELTLHLRSGRVLTVPAPVRRGPRP